MRAVEEKQVWNRVRSFHARGVTKSIYSFHRSDITKLLSETIEIFAAKKSRKTYYSGMSCSQSIKNQFSEFGDVFGNYQFFQNV